MDTENFFTRTAATTKGSGRITKWTDGVNFSTKAENWHTKEIGPRMNSTVLVRFTTTILSNLNADSTLPTLTFWRTTGNFMKGCSFRTPKREGEK